MTSVPGGGDALNLHVKIVYTSRPSSVPFPPPYIPAPPFGSGTKDAKPTACLHCTIMSDVNTRNSVRCTAVAAEDWSAPLIFALVLLLRDLPPPSPARPTGPTCTGRGSGPIVVEFLLAPGFFNT